MCYVREGLQRFPAKWEPVRRRKRVRPNTAGAGQARLGTEIVTRLNAELRKIIDNPEIRAWMGTLGFEAFSSTPGELGDFVKVQFVKWSKMIKDSGIEPE